MRGEGGQSGQRFRGEATSPRKSIVPSKLLAGETFEDLVSSILRTKKREMKEVVCVVWHSISSRRFSSRLLNRSRPPSNASIHHAVLAIPAFRHPLEPCRGCGIFARSKRAPLYTYIFVSYICIFISIFICIVLFCICCFEVSHNIVHDSLSLTRIRLIKYSIS